jgi:hypothetical protein
MKDAKGHGSDPRGSAAHQSGVEDIFAKSTRQYNEAEAITKGILAQPNPSAIFEKGDQKIVLSKSLDPRYDLRVTNFDKAGPVGHREYNKSDVGEITREIADAHIGGYTLRAKK